MRDKLGRFIKDYNSSPYKKNGKDVICQVCGKKFYISGCKIQEARYKNGYFLEWKRKYCSKKCWMKVHKQGEDKKCLYCGKEFYVNKYRKDIAKFCSYKCLNKHNGILHRGKNHPLWTGLTSISQLIRGNKLSQQWRMEVMERDNYICQECKDNKGGNLEAHHKNKSFNSILREFLSIYNQFSPLEDTDILLRLAERYEPFWDIDNGITLCEECHNKIEVEV